MKVHLSSISKGSQLLFDLKMRVLGRSEPIIYKVDEHSASAIMSKFAELHNYANTVYYEKPSFRSSLSRIESEKWA